MILFSFVINQQSTIHPCIQLFKADWPSTALFMFQHRYRFDWKAQVIYLPRQTVHVKAGSITSYPN